MQILLYSHPRPFVTSGTLRAASVAEAPAAYLPRHPERTAFYRIFQEHFDRYALAHEERFESTSGPLRSVVRKSVDEFLDCGRLHGGFARIRCPSCKSEHLLAFSCQTRNLCPSCQAKRAALFAEKLREHILSPVPHRHIVFTIPKALRRLFERERRLLTILSRSAYDAVRKTLGELLDDDVRPGFVASLQTFGSYAANFHPHVHAIVTEGAFTKDGEFLGLCDLNTSLIEEVFRRLVLNRLHRAQRLSEGFMNSLLSWVHSGFSVHATQRLEADDADRIEKLARYLTRAPIRLDSIEITETGRVQATTPTDPGSGATYLVLDPLDFIHNVTTQIPDPKSHLVRYYGAYANRLRRSFASRRPSQDTNHHQEDRDDDSADDSPEQQKSRSSWARLLKRIMEVDPLICTRCQATMKIISVITDPHVIDRILKHPNRDSNQDPFEPRGPPKASLDA